MANIDFNTVALASTANTSDYIHLTTEGGSHRKVLLQKLIDKAKKEVLSHAEAQMLDILTEGCYIMYHQSAWNIPSCRRASQWVAMQNQGEVADGVLVIEGDKHIVVAPTESPTDLRWSSVNASANPTLDVFFSNNNETFDNFNGKAATTGILSNASLCNDGTEYAPAFCAAYSRTNKNGKGLNAGKWWLPSTGELHMILKNYQKINACLVLIEGATTIQETGYYWSSTEHGSNYAWGVSVNGCGVAGKLNNYRHVRPVSSYQR